MPPNKLKCSKRTGNDQNGDCQIKSDDGTILANIHVEKGIIEKVQVNDSLFKEDGLAFKFTTDITRLLRNKKAKFDKNLIIIE